MLVAILGACIGYAVATTLALSLDLLYTGAPIRNPVATYMNRNSALLWAGTLGYLAAGRKSSDGAPLPARFWYVPLLGTLAGLVIAHHATGVRHAILMGLFSFVLLALTAADFERHLLPNRLLYPALVAAVLLGWAWPGRSWLSSLEGGAIAMLVMLSFFVIFPKLGFGDVKLSALLGLISGVSHALPALAVGVVAGGIGALVLLAAGRAGRGSLIAYGPYLALGAFAGMLMR
jgi:leader peptidase (prepilin peptidase)/N-methyltransferase